MNCVDDCEYREMLDDANADLQELKAENSELRELVNQMYRDMQGVLDMSSDTVWVDAIGTLRDRMDYHMQVMSALGIPPMDCEYRMRELGVEGT